MRQIWWAALGLVGCSGPLEGQWVGEVDCYQEDRTYTLLYELDIVTEDATNYTGDGEYEGIGTLGADTMVVSGQIDDLEITLSKKKGEQDIGVIGELDDCRQYVNDELAVSDCSEANFSGSGWEWVWDGDDEIEISIESVDGTEECGGELELDE